MPLYDIPIFKLHAQVGYAALWAVQDSDLWPLPCEGNALPTELTARTALRKKI
jgi:hypothetical protein